MAAVPPPPPTAAQIVYAQRELRDIMLFQQEKFSRYRNGDASYTKSLLDIEAEYRNGITAHANRILARRIPRANYTGTFTSADQRRLQARADHVAGVNRNNRRYGNPAPPNMNLNAQRTATGRTMFGRATALMPARNHFTFVKILGAGGNGMVTL
ncbi:hypothetical protein Daus18300_010800 [Diaporthe australafricana]|uniref:Uncharacterized protein n=1 Tax=Diaporthe australafricana TaxID=127596 RepID=A0ABR3W8V8_9PEZI